MSGFHINMFFLIAYFIISKPESRSAFNVRRVFMRDAKEATIEGYLHDKIYLQSRVKVPCFGKKYPPKGVRSFAWEHSGKHLSDDDEKYRVDDDGALTINDASLDDAGVFFCRTNTTNGMKVIKHMIEVVQMPYAVLQIFIFYEVKYCNAKSELLAKSFVESKLKGNICLKGECRINLIRGVCHLDDVPSLQVKVLITFPEVPDGSCDVTCTRERYRDLPLQVSRNVANIMEKNKLELSDEKELSTSNYFVKNDRICDLGFEKKESGANSLCVPCKPGYFFDKGYCIPCPYNHYTEQYGAKECRRCGKSLETSARGANSKQSCQITESKFLLLIFVVLLPILLIMVFCYRCIRCCTKKTAATSKNCSTSHKRKSKHLSKHLDVQSSSESEAERKSRSIPIVNKSKNHPKSSKKDSNYHHVEMVGEKEKRAPKTRGNIPPPPPMPTDSAMKRVARNNKGR